MKRFEVVFFVDAPTLRDAKRAAKEIIKYGLGADEIMFGLIDNLREVKPTRQNRGRVVSDLTRRRLVQPRGNA